MKPSLSIIIITKNEANNIGDCLASVAWADEIIVVDSGSSDDTVAICKRAGATVQTTKDWPGFGIQKQRALNLASKEWVLSIDADEIVSEALRDEIKTTIQSAPQQLAFKIPRSSSFCGQFMRHSGWYPDYVTRLFRRTEAKFSEAIVHEKILHAHAPAALKNPLIHYSYANLSEMIDKLDHYSSAGAAMLKAKKKQTSLTGAVLRGLWAFIRTYCIKLGFLDGRMGFVLAVYNAQTTYYKYLKLMLLNKKNHNRSTE